MSHSPGQGDSRLPRTGRRNLLQGLALGGLGLGLPNLLALRQAAAASSGSQRDTAVIFVQCGGGASQFETYDPKPDAPAEYRGEFRPTATSVPGVSICELLPRQAKLMDQLAVVRSVTHHEASHIALHVVETGYFLRDNANIRKGEMPSLGAIVSRVRGSLTGGLPSNISLRRPGAYSSASYLGAQYDQFVVREDPSLPEFQIPNLSVHDDLTSLRLRQRYALRGQLDQAAGGGSGSDDQHQAFLQQAVDLITGERAQQAFDLSREKAAVCDRYGRNEVGQRMLLARRLVEADVPFVMVRMGDWDDHENLREKMIARCEIFDRGLSALIEELAERSLTRRVLVVAMGEFGRTPRVNAKGGRDHWPAVNSVLFAGGSYQMGQAIGASDAKGAAVAEAPYPPQSVLAMVYRHLGIDPGLTFRDHAGRPRYVLEEREEIRELL